MPALRPAHLPVVHELGLGRLPLPGVREGPASRRSYTAQTLLTSRPLVTQVLIGINVAVFLVGCGGRPGRRAVRRQQRPARQRRPQRVRHRAQRRVVAHRDLRVPALRRAAPGVQHVRPLDPRRSARGCRSAPGGSPWSTWPRWWPAPWVRSSSPRTRSPRARRPRSTGCSACCSPPTAAAGISIWDSGLGGVLLINLFITFGISNISIGGHIGGLAGGFICGYHHLQRRPQDPQRTRGARPVRVRRVGVAPASAGPRRRPGSSGLSVRLDEALRLARLRFHTRFST